MLSYESMAFSELGDLADLEFCRSESGKEIDCVTLSSLLFCNLHCFSLSFPFLNSSFARFELNKLHLKWRIN
ncbi:hypothetical protein V6N13_079385 [Hibiscus sabdariffa]|uniref:Uncharacterized protein n=1 Tax=Hibiscus sabdariffa TaxID=183260 RepID=A0ABR2RRJ3_9ROSI